MNDTIWLKIDEGEKKIFNSLTTFTKRIVAGIIGSKIYSTYGSWSPTTSDAIRLLIASTRLGKTVLRVLLNNGRYFFDYDELTGDFAMEIRPVHVDEDAGVWQCHVTVYQRGNTHTLTSRSRVKMPHGVSVACDRINVNGSARPFFHSELFALLNLYKEYEKVLLYSSQSLLIGSYFAVRRTTGFRMTENSDGMHPQ